MLNENQVAELSTLGATQQATQQAPAPAIKDLPTLSDVGLRVQLSIGVPTLRKKDKTATSKVLIDNHSAQGVAHVSKKLLVSALHDEIVKLVNATRTYHREQTIPWGDMGDRLLVNDKLIDYQNQMGTFERELNMRRDQFLQAYPGLANRAQVELGDLYDEADYPNVVELERKFKFSVAIEPIPDNDFRCKVGSDALQELSEQYEQVCESRINAAMNDVWARLREPLENMSKRLEYDDEGKPLNGHFKGTIVDNVIQITDLMKHCNLTKDPAMEQIRIDLRNALTGVTYDGLKSSDTMRRKTKAEVDKIISNLPSLGW